MKAIAELEKLGFEFALDGGRVRYAHTGKRPNPDCVRPMLDYLTRHRDEAVAFLRERTAFLEEMDDMPLHEQCRRYADIATRAGWPCTGYPSWAVWLKDVPEAPSLPPREK